MKLKQHLIIKQYFIDYSLGKYTFDTPTVPEYLVKELSQPDYENQLEITKLSVNETSVNASFKSTKVVAENQTYDFSKPNELDLFEAKYLDSVTYPTVKDIPMDVVDDLFLVEELEGCKPVIFVNKEFKNLDEEGKFKHAIEIFKNRVRVDYSEPETILGQVFDLDKDSSWDEELHQLVINSAVLKGRVCVVDDTRRYELRDSHIGKLTYSGVDDTPPTQGNGNLIVKTTSGETLELDLTNPEQVQEWFDNMWVSDFDTQLAILKQDVSEIVDWGGPKLHMSEDETMDIKGYVTNLPELVKIPDYLPEWVTNLDGFLAASAKFNQPLNLDTSNVTSMEAFLSGAASFNQPLDLNTSKVTSMHSFLRGTTSFNQPLNLDTSNVTNMESFLVGATSFNQELNLNTSKVTSMDYFLDGATSFNQPLNLDTSNVTSMNNFLDGATSFNQPLNLDTSNVTSMGGFLHGATNFNQPLNLDTSNVDNMTSFLLGAGKFDQPLNLNTVSVTHMDFFLSDASSFNQDLSHLCVPLIKEEPTGFAVGAAAYTKPRPVWGTCPGKE